MNNLKRYYSNLIKKTYRKSNVKNKRKHNITFRDPPYINEYKKQKSIYYILSFVSILFTCIIIRIILHYLFKFCLVYSYSTSELLVLKLFYYFLFFIIFIAICLDYDDD